MTFLPLSRHGPGCCVSVQRLLRRALNISERLACLPYPEVGHPTLLNASRFRALPPLASTPAALVSLIVPPLLLLLSLSHTLSSLFPIYCSVVLLSTHIRLYLYGDQPQLLRYDNDITHSVLSRVSRLSCFRTFRYQALNAQVAKARYLTLCLLVI